MFAFAMNELKFYNEQCTMNNAQIPAVYTALKIGQHRMCTLCTNQPATMHTYQLCTQHKYQLCTQHKYQLCTQH